MKTVTILSCIVMLIALKTNAQEKTPRTPDERATALTQWMKTNLNLTPEQEESVQSINLKYANLNEELKSNDQSRLQKAKTLKANDQAKDKELKELLTDEQFKAYLSKKDELKEKLREEAKARRGGS